MESAAATSCVETSSHHAVSRRALGAGALTGAARDPLNRSSHLTRPEAGGRLHRRLERPRLRWPSPRSTSPVPRPSTLLATWAMRPLPASSNGAARSPCSVSASRRSGEIPRRVATRRLREGPRTPRSGSACWNRRAWEAAPLQCRPPVTEPVLPWPGRFQLRMKSWRKTLTPSMLTVRLNRFLDRRRPRPCERCQPDVVDRRHCPPPPATLRVRCAAASSHGQCYFAIPRPDNPPYIPRFTQ